MENDFRRQLEQRARELAPWRYNHAHDGVVISSDTSAAVGFDQYARGLMSDMVRVLLTGQEIRKLRATDLGCLEGHYSDILCSLGMQEVVAIDLSDGHVRRAQFLLRDLKRYSNATVIQGNVSDEKTMSALGRFNLIFFHGLLYHLKDPLKIFDVLEQIIDPKGPSFLLLSTQYRCSYRTLISPVPMGEMQVKPLQAAHQTPGEKLLEDPSIGSVFERCSFILNPAAVHRTLQLYGYKNIVAYDDPSGYSYSFNSNIIATKEPSPGLVDELNPKVKIPGVRFYPWDGRSVNSYRFDRNPRARVAKVISRASGKMVELLK